MPLDDIPTEAFGHVFKSLGAPALQARLRAVNREMVRAFCLAVLNEQFVDVAGSMDATDTLTNYDVRWVPVDCGIADSRHYALKTLAVVSSATRIPVNVEHWIMVGRVSSRTQEHTAIPMLYGATARRVTLPVGLQLLPDKFMWCPTSTLLDIPQTVTGLGAEVLYMARGLQSIVLPDSITSIGPRCLHECPSLTSVTLPAGIRQLPDGFLHDCPSLTSLEISPTVTQLGAVVLDQEGASKSIVLPDSIISVGLGCLLSGCDCQPEYKWVIRGRQSKCPSAACNLIYYTMGSLLFCNFPVP